MLVKTETGKTLPLASLYYKHGIRPPDENLTPCCTSTPLCAISRTQNSCKGGLYSPMYTPPFTNILNDYNGAP